MARFSKSGANNPGYCKLCSLSEPKLQDEFDRRVLDYTPRQLNTWLRERVENFKDISNPTIYKHREHVKHPKDRVVSVVEKRKREGNYLPQRTSEQQFLDSIITLGYDKAMNDPDSVTIDHALKATQIKSQAKQKGDAHNVLVQIFTGNVPSLGGMVIEGEAVELG